MTVPEEEPNDSQKPLPLARYQAYRLLTIFSWNSIAPMSQGLCRGSPSWSISGQAASFPASIA